MKEEECCKTEIECEEKPGFFKRMVDKLDSKMKEKADEQADDDCCSDDGKGSKCC